jgi:hypothetical protein
MYFLTKVIVTRMEWIIPCAFFILLSSCAQQEHADVGSADSSLYSRYGLVIDHDRQLVDSIHVDLNQDGVDECIMTFGQRTSESGENRGFDVVHVLKYDKLNATWNSHFVDAVNNAHKLVVRDVAGDAKPELIAKLNSGASDSTWARGMHVYGLRSDSQFTLLFYESSGNPRFVDLDDDGILEICLSGQYRGINSELEPIVYTEAVYRFNDMAYVIDNSRFSAYFSTEINSRTRSYTELMSAEIIDQQALFHISMELILWKEVKGNAEDILQFWTTEKDYLKLRLTETQFKEVAYLVDRIQQPITQPLVEQGI